MFDLRVKGLTKHFLESDDAWNAESAGPWLAMASQWLGMQKFPIRLGMAEDLETFAAFWSFRVCASSILEAFPNGEKNANKTFYNKIELMKNPTPSRAYKLLL